MTHTTQTTSTTYANCLLSTTYKKQDIFSIT
nr:MAG TPA: hypothetical protein [Bacteriophage sp.]